MLLSNVEIRDCLVCEQSCATRWLVCDGCARDVDDETIARLETERKKLAVWLPKAEALLMGWGADDERYGRGFALWKRRLRRYEQLCLLCPEAVA